MVDLLPNARKLDNYEIDATGGTLWTSTTTFKVSCPVGKRWFFFGGVIKRTVSATVTADLYNVGDDLIRRLCVEAAATGQSSYPNNVAANTAPSFAGYYVMDVGDYILLTFGVAQNSTAYASCQVLEIDM